MDLNWPLLISIEFSMNPVRHIRNSEVTGISEENDNPHEEASKLFQV